MKSYLAIDIQPRRGKAFLGSVTPGGVQLVEVGSFPVRAVEVFGRWMWDLPSVYLGILDVLRRVAAWGVDVASVGLCSFGFDFCCLGVDGRMLSLPDAFVGKMSSPAPGRYFERMSRKMLYRVVAQQALPYKTLFQLDAMQRAGDVPLSVADKLLFFPDALTYMLTGEVVVESTIVGSSGLVDVATRCLDQRVLASVGLSSRRFGTFVEPGMAVGVLSDNVRRQTGLPPVPVVAVAGYDVASAMLSVPTAETDFAFVFCGYMASVGVETSRPIVDARVEGADLSVTHGVGGAVHIHRQSMGLRLLQVCGDEIGVGAGGCALPGVGGARSIVSTDDPAFADPWHVVEAVRRQCADTGQRVPAGRGEVEECLRLSLANRYAELVRTVLAATRLSVGAVHVVGPGAADAAMCQYLADISGRRVVAGPVEATAVGNVLAQALAGGEILNVCDVRSRLSARVAAASFEPRGL